MNRCRAFVPPMVVMVVVVVIAIVMMLVVMMLLLLLLRLLRLQFVLLIWSAQVLVGPDCSRFTN